LIAVFAVAAIVSLCYVVRSRAFTLIEVQYLPAVQLVALQSAAVEVSNISIDAEDVTVEIFAGVGPLLVTETRTLNAGQTLTVPYKYMGQTATKTIRVVISTSAAHATVCSLLTFDKTSGEVITAMPGVILP